MDLLPTAGQAASPLQLLMSAIGGQTQQSGNTSSTGTNNTQTTGTQNSQTTGQQTGTSNQQTKNTADITGLQQIFAKQSAGVTPEMLQAIFSEGAAATPQLTNTLANAVGARSTGNSPLALGTTNLITDLTNKAALLNAQMLQQAGVTAGQIAQNTQQSTTTGQQSGTNSQNQTGGSTSNTTGQTTNNQDSSQESATSINTDMLGKLLMGVLGGSVLNGALPGGISGAAGGAGSAITGVLKSIFGGGGGGNSAPPLSLEEQATWDQIMANNPDLYAQPDYQSPIPEVEGFWSGGGDTWDWYDGGS